MCVRNVIRPCDVGHRGKDLTAGTLLTMQLTGVEAVMPRSISQLLIGATVAIGFAVVGVTALGTAVAQSPFEQTKSTTNRYEPAVSETDLQIGDHQQFRNPREGALLRLRAKDESPDLPLTVVSPAGPGCSPQPGPVYQLRIYSEKKLGEITWCVR
jgi:hypothetical protein